MTRPSRQAAGLYLHLPFCSAICPYCDFAVLVGGSQRRARFVDALVQEIEQVTERGLSPGYNTGFDTIYFGGGTPSALEFDELARILTTLRARLQITADARIFFEANPEDIAHTVLTAWRQLGISTLSLGVQSFRDQELIFLGRRHRAQEARQAACLARETGFDTVSIDLIYGLPEQSQAHWQYSLETALALEPDHLSCYELEIHQRTPFGKMQRRGELVELPESAQASLFLFTHRWLEEAGYPAYEVSNFARGPEHHSRHNRKYWYHVPYLGFGPSAHSFDGQTRFWNERHFESWQRRLKQGEVPRTGVERLNRNDLALETVMLALRTPQGLDLAQFEKRFEVDLLALNDSQLQQWISDGYLRLESDWLVPTLEGLVIADGLAAAMVLG